AYIRDFTNFFPQANFTYTYKSNHSLRFNYNGSNRQPTISQLQPLANNNDYFTQYLGNPDLKPSFTNSFSVTNNGFNFLKERWMYQSISFNLNSNAITNDRVINPVTGQTTIRPINTNGNYSINMWSSVGQKLKKLKMQVFLDPNFNYSRFADVINSKTSYSNNFTGGLRLGVNKTKDKKYDFNISNNLMYNSNKTSQSNEAISFITNDVSLSGTVYYKKVWSISTDYEYYYRQKTPQFSNSINNHLWNARLQRTFKKNEYTAYFAVRDILNQNIGITRNFYSNTLTEERNDRLKRFWMLGFTWDFKNKSAATKTHARINSPPIVGVPCLVFWWRSGVSSRT
ncbi:MAG: TonB-dependent receptor, partial [Cytophagaceae bacterium]